MPRDILQAAQGRWPEILHGLAGLTTQQLTNTHQPCPICGGTDRYRFDDNQGRGTWICSGGKNRAGCARAGNGMDLLLLATGWDFATAARRIESHLNLPPEITPSRSRPHRIPDIPPPGAPPPRLGKATAQWCYRSLTGQQLFWIQRLDLPPTADKPGRKLFIHRVWLDGQWHYPRSRGEKADAFSCEWPTPRPLYRLPDLAARPDARVLVVEGEKAADAAAALFPTAVVVSWSNGSKAVDLVDWSPLAGRKVILWPDNDVDGQLAMGRLALRLQPIAASVRRIEPPADAPEGWDVADATWTQQEAAAFVRDHLRDIDPDQLTLELAQKKAGPENKAGQQSHTQTAFLTQPDQPTASDASEPEALPPTNRYFSCLGFDNEGYYYQPHGTGQVVRLGRGSHSSTNLVALAPLGYWEAHYPGRSSPNWVAAASDLFWQQASIGVYDPSRIRGRGAWSDSGRVVLHLGDRLIVDGQPHPITKRLPRSPYLYQRLASLQGPGDATPLNDDEASIVALISQQFRWEVPASGLLLAGSIALGPICGALPWRPHIWLTGCAGSGKTAILDRFVTPLVSDMGLFVSGNTTEAAIRQALGADARYVVFDEAESNEDGDRKRVQNILGLARVSSSETRAKILKGTPEGTAQSYQPRSMFLFSSIAPGLQQGADKRRFSQLTLRNPGNSSHDERQAHWEALDRDLERFITEEFGRRLQARTVALIPTIRQSIKTFTRAAAEHFDSQALGDQYGTLLAGAWALQSSEPATEHQARALIAANDWEPYSQATEVPDERRCIQRLLQHQVRVEADRPLTRTMGELVEIALHRAPDFHIEASLAEATLGRNGIRVEADAIFVSNTAEAIAAILRDTAWVNCWPTTLSRLQGATKSGVTYFRGAGASSRAVRVPLAALDNAPP
jgi:putative DNA primase/helicase